MVSHKSKREIKFIKKESPLYPSLLKEIADPPSGIYIWGSLPHEERPRIAIVGTRKATTAGKFIAKRVARELGDLGAVIVSGLAMGIDTIAHEGALEAKTGTIAVLGNGLDSIYPRQNENLANRIIESHGAIISEYPAGTPAFPGQFLERNRIVSGMCLATIIIEAPIDSGALVTARLAAEQGREVFVFPGPVEHPNYRGSHKLIRDGARLVSSVEDILEDLGLDSLKSKAADFKKTGIADRNQLLIFEVIQGAGQPLNIDKIAELTKLEPQVINQAIAILIINGLIRETEKGYTTS